MIRRMRFVCWITKATDTHSEYVIIITFSWQQWLLERASTVRYSTCPVFLTYFISVQHWTCFWKFTCSFVYFVLHGTVFERNFIYKTSRKIILMTHNTVQLTAYVQEKKNISHAQWPDLHETQQRTGRVSSLIPAQIRRHKWAHSLCLSSSYFPRSEYPMKISCVLQTDCLWRIPLSSFLTDQTKV